MAEWEEREVMMAVKAYGTPTEEVGEAICTAGVDRERAIGSEYPVAFRDLPFEQRFSKYQRIRGRFKKRSDPRPESHDLDHDSIVCLKTVGTENGTWTQRKALIAPLGMRPLAPSGLGKRGETD